MHVFLLPKEHSGSCLVCRNHSRRCSQYLLVASGYIRSSIIVSRLLLCFTSQVFYIYIRMMFGRVWHGRAAPGRRWNYYDVYACSYHKCDLLRDLRISTWEDSYITASNCICCLHRDRHIGLIKLCLRDVMSCLYNVYMDSSRVDRKTR